MDSANCTIGKWKLANLIQAELAFDECLKAAKLYSKSGLHATVDSDID